MQERWYETLIISQINECLEPTEKIGKQMYIYVF